MTAEIEQLKERIDYSGTEGVKTEHIKDDYDPIGEKMINQLIESGEYVCRKVSAGRFKFNWKIFNKKSKPF